MNKVELEGKVDGLNDEISFLKTLNETVSSRVGGMPSSGLGKEPHRPSSGRGWAKASTLTGPHRRSCCVHRIFSFSLLILPDSVFEMPEARVGRTNQPVLGPHWLLPTPASSFSFPWVGSSVVCNGAGHVPDMQPSVLSGPCRS